MLTNLTRRRFVQTTLAAVAASTLPAGRTHAAAPAPAPGTSPWPFYVMDNGLGGPDVPALGDKLKLAKDLGFTGVDFHLSHAALPQQLEALDKHALELTALYVTPLVEGQADAALPASIARLKGRPTRIELAITSKQYKPSDPQADKLGVDLVRRVADLCADSGPVVSIYPHKSFWTERTEDGLRLTKLAERKNVGTNFNLVHWKWCKQDRPVAELLKDALPHLLTVTICGLAGAKDAIVPLDKSDFDLLAFLTTLKQTGYRGRVGLQCFSIPGPSREHLTGSMKKWREMVQKLA